MSRSELHNWECAIEELSGDNADKMLAIAQDIYNTAFVHGKNYMSWEQTRWIPVSERLPEIQRGVLLELRNGDILTGFKSETEPYFYVIGVDECYVEPINVIAWMPLPEPYVPDTNIGKMSEIPTGCSNSDSCENCKYSEGDCCRLIYEAKMIDPQERNCEPQERSEKE